MKICVPTEDKNGFDAEVSAHFGRAPFYALIDSDSNEVDFVENSDTGHDHGSCVGAALAAELKPEVVLTSFMGRGAFEMLHSSGARIFRTDNNRLSGALAAFTEGNAPELVSSEAAGHHHSGNEAHGHGEGCCGGHSGHEHRHTGHGRV